MALIEGGEESGKWDEVACQVDKAPMAGLVWAIAQNDEACEGLYWRAFDEGAMVGYEEETDEPCVTITKNLNVARVVSRKVGLRVFDSYKLDLLNLIESNKIDLEHDEDDLAVTATVTLTKGVRVGKKHDSLRMAIAQAVAVSQYGEVIQVPKVFLPE